MQSLKPTKMSVFLFITVIFSFLYATSQPDIHPLLGYWEGEFMPGNNLTMILHFTNNQGDDAGRLFLFQEKIQIQDDPIDQILLIDHDLSFRIEAKNTTFQGKLGNEGPSITGNLFFPDGSVHSLSVQKVEQPSLGYFPNFQTDQENTVEQQYSIPQLQEDFQFMRDVLEHNHPQLYLYTTKDEFDNLFDSTVQSIDRSIKQDEFFRLLAPVVAKIRCSHTGIRFSEPFSSGLNTQPHLIPLDIKWIGEKAYIVHNYSQDSSIEPGMRILSINGKLISDIYKRLISNIPSDGFNKTFIIFELNHDFPSLYSLYIENSDHFILECLSGIEQKLTVNLPAYNTNELANAVQQIDPVNTQMSELPLNMEILLDIQTALLTVEGFWTQDWRQFTAFLEESFNTMKEKNLSGLIIDLRGNRGGHPFFASELYAYISPSEYIYFDSTEGQHDEFAPLYLPQQQKPNCFQGKIYILMDGGCLSSAGHFLSLIKYHGLATLIGEESGGSFYCNDNSMTLSLPNTGILLNVPRTTFQTAVSGFEKGDPILPDHLINPTLEDYLKESDVEMQFVLDLIENMQ